MIRTQVVDRKWQLQKVKSRFCGSWKNDPDHDPLFILVFLKKIGSWSVIVLPKNSIAKKQTSNFFHHSKGWHHPVVYVPCFLPLCLPGNASFTSLYSLEGYISGTKLSSLDFNFLTIFFFIFAWKIVVVLPGTQF